MGCPIDPRQSIVWYSRAAVQEEHQSELALSGWYLTGSEGVLQQSDTEAYLWARKAAQAGLAKAEYAMGYFTEVGIGAPTNIEDAKRWYWRAACKYGLSIMRRMSLILEQHKTSQRPENDWRIYEKEALRCRSPRPSRVLPWTDGVTASVASCNQRVSVVMPWTVRMVKSLGCDAPFIACPTVFQGFWLVRIARRSEWASIRTRTYDTLGGEGLPPHLQLR